MIDITALLIAGMETKYAILGALCIVCAGVFTALYFSLKQNSNKQTLKDEICEHDINIHKETCFECTIKKSHYIFD